MARILEFSEIDNLFLKYKDASLQENTEKYLDKLKNDIITSLWNNLRTKKRIAAALVENADVMVDTTSYCIKQYSKYEDCKGFAAYTTKSIKNKLITSSIDSDFQDATGGMHVSDNYKETQSKLKRLYKSFIALRKTNSSECELNNSFVEYASKYLGIDKGTVTDFLYPKKATSIESNNSEDDLYDITDIFGGTNDYSPVNLYEQNEENTEILSKINKEWKLQKDDSKALMSELLTLIVIEALNRKFISIEYISLEPYEFINRKMLKIFYINHDESIPSQQEIGEKYGLTKSGVSKKISRFFEKIDFS